MGHTIVGLLIAIFAKVYITVYYSGSDDPNLTCQLLNLLG